MVIVLIISIAVIISTQLQIITIIDVKGKTTAGKKTTGRKTKAAGKNITGRKTAGNKAAGKILRVGKSGIDMGWEQHVDY